MNVAAVTEFFSEGIGRTNQPMSADAEAYKYAFRDIVYDLVQRARKNEEPDIGYRTAMLNVLGHIKNQAKVFELDLEYLGLSDFDPEDWFISTCQNSN